MAPSMRYEDLDPRVAYRKNGLNGCIRHLTLSLCNTRNLIKLYPIFSLSLPGVARAHTGVRNDSATNRALAFNWFSQHRGEINQWSRVRTKSFISDISLSTSSMNCMMKSTSLCLSISSV